MSYDKRPDEYDADDDAYDEAYDDDHELGPEDADLLGDEFGSVDQVPCPACGKYVLEEIGLCPHCGHNLIEPLDSEWRAATWFWPIVIAALVALLFWFT